jgi:Cysteine-rich secretory protein family
VSAAAADVAALGHFTQMVWVNSKYFGIGKAISKTGKFFIVAYYYPPGECQFFMDMFRYEKKGLTYRLTRKKCVRLAEQVNCEQY